MFKPRSDPSIWYGPEVEKKEEEWLLYFTPPELEELITAAKKFVEMNNSQDEKYLSLDLLEDFDSNFKLSLIKSKTKDMSKKLHNGLGFILLKGFPIETLDRKVIAASFLLLGKCLGNLRAQNATGHVLGHVKDFGLASTDPKVRVYQTRERQTFHTDSCDVVGLLCLQTSKSGGLSSLVSSGTIYNEMQKQNESLLSQLFQSFATDKRGELKEGEAPFFNIPVYSEYQGYLSAIYQRQYIDSAQRFPEAGRLSEKQIMALDLFDKLADDPKLNFSMELKPGDIQFVHNHSLLHDRTGFEDCDEEDKKRHLLRIWIATPEARPLPSVFSERFGSVEIGNRGGVCIPGVQSIAPIYL